MAIDKKFIDQFIDVTSKAALASSHLVGKKDKIAADKAATDSMRRELNKINIQGEIVIGEGELDEAPMLYIGEKLGNNNNGPKFDIAVDPLEGTNFAANNLPGALSVIAIAEKNNLFKAPETYMEKISTRVNERNIVDLDFTVKQNIFNLSDYLNKKPENLTACILDRPRHKAIIDDSVIARSSDVIPMEARMAPAKSKVPTPGSSAGISDLKKGISNPVDAVSKNK